MRSIYFLILTNCCLFSCQTINKGLVAHYSFDNRVEDASKSKLHGKAEGAKKIFSSSDKNEKRNSTYQFKNDKDVLIVPHNDALNLTEELSISVWIKPLATNINGSRIVDKIISGTGKGFLVDLYDPKRPSESQSARVRFIGTEGFTSITEEQVQLKKWSHLAVTYSRGQVKMYINGNLVNETREKSTLLSTNQEDLQIGNDIYGEGPDLYDPFKGEIDEVRIYKRVISEKEVNLLSKL